MVRRVVLADDSETIRKVVELVLEPEGCSVTTYRDGEAAMQAISTQPPDLVLADVDLPLMSGIFLCRSIKDNAETAAMPVILLVGAFQSFDEDSARLSGADDIIIKPFESRELVSKTKALLANRPVAAVPFSHPETPVKKTVADEEASLDAELARQWAESLDEPEQPSPVPATVSSEFTSRHENASAVTSAALGELPLSDEDLANQWVAAMADDDENKETTDNTQAASATSVGVDDELARQWEATLIQETAASVKDAAATIGQASPSPVAGGASFAELLSAELETSSEVSLHPDAMLSARQVEQRTAGGELQTAMQNPLMPDEIRTLVRTAVDEALAELLQSERSRIQKEFEATVRKAIKDVAEAILVRELNRSVSAD